jgi:putative nucleotidyltransferase-like protein
MSNIPDHFNAMLAALQFRGSRPEALRNLTDSEWEDLLSGWEFIRLTVSLRHVCGDILPDWVRSRIDRNLADNAERFERIKADYLNFVTALRRTGAEHLVLKGFAQSPGYVEHPRFRLQTDIDLFCPPESISRARDALYVLGYEPTKELDFRAADHWPTMVRKTRWKWRGNHFDPDMPVSFELHFCFWNETVARFAPTGLDQFWLRRVERRLDDLSFPALSAVDNLGYTALNLTRNLLRDGASPYQVYELARFLHMNADNEQFWKTWRESHDDSLRCLEAISFRLAADRFACSLAEDVQREIHRLPIAVKRWFDSFAWSPFTAPFSSNQDGLWLHLSLLESSADKRSVLRERLVPTRLPPIERVDLADGSSVTEGVQRSSSWKRARYVAHMIPRAANHVRMLPSTLWHGLRWCWSTRSSERESTDVDRGYAALLHRPLPLAVATETKSSPSRKGTRALLAPLVDHESDSSAVQKVS